MRIVRTTLATAAMVFALAPSGAASAAPVAGTDYVVVSGIGNQFISCPSGWLCLYTNADFSGLQVRWPAGNYHPDFDSIACPEGYCRSEDDFNDEVTSWANNGTGIRYCISEMRDGGGWDLTMPSGQQSRNVGSSVNDRASSLSNSGCP